MIVYLDVGGKLEKCHLTNERDGSLLAELAEFSARSIWNMDDLESLRAIRKGISQMIAESGNYKVVG